MQPVVGMIVAILLRIRVLEKLALTVGLIILMLCRYLLPAVYISRRIDRLMLS
jgi:hypothetical protein